MWVFGAYATLLFPFAAVPLARTLTARADPRWATWLLSLAAVTLAATSCGALGLLTLDALVRLPWLAHLGHWSRAVVADGGAIAPTVALVAGVLLGAALLAVIGFSVRWVRALVDAFQHARALPGRDALVVTGDPVADAYTVPGRPGRIVVSAGMLDALDAPGRAALLAHERAHLSGRHYVFTTAARLAAAANPLLRPLAAAVEFTVERWADEDAAAAVGDRRLVAETIAHAAVAKRAGRAHGRREPALAFGAVPRFTPAHSLAGAGPIPRRVAALLAPRPRGLLVLAVGLLLVGLASVCALKSADGLHDLLRAARVARHAARG